MENLTFPAMNNYLENENESETPLTGGGRTAVWRKGQVVMRETGPWASTVHSFLRHLEKIGFSSSPRIIGSGFDKMGREMLSYIDGKSAHPFPWDEQSLFGIGKLIRDLHSAADSFIIPADAIWREWHGRKIGSNKKTVGHCDTGPWNILLANDSSLALIDWEVAGPVDPLVDLAQCCWLNAQLHDDDVADQVGLAPLKDRARHLRCILDGYGLPRNSREDFIETMIEFAVHDSANQAIEANVTPQTMDYSSLWGITWRTRSAAWMMRNKSILRNAIL